MPSIKIEVDTYPVAPLNQLLGTILQMGWYACIGVALLGAGMLPPAIVAQLPNRWTLIGIGFFLNMVGSNLLQTGAFEVSLDGKQLYSKLETGAIPAFQELYDIIRQNIKS